MSDRGTVSLLFDLSFSEFITTRIIKVLFIVGIAVAALGALGILISGFAIGLTHGILMLIVSPIVFLLYVLLVRVWCEIIIVMFRIAENTSRLVEQGKLQQ